MNVPTANSTRLITSAFCFCLLAGSAWSNPIKHPSDYGATPVTLANCGSPTTKNSVVATCFVGSGSGFNDFLFSFALASPQLTTSITSVTFNFPVTVADFGLVEGSSTDPCSGLTNVPCLDEGSLVTITGNPPTLPAGLNTFGFTNFTGDLSGQVTAFFTLSSTRTAPTFTAATTSSTTATPEPSELGLLTAALASLVVVRRRRQAKQNV